jgi:hypothetical protein
VRSAFKTYFNAEVVLVEAGAAVGLSGDELVDRGDHGGGEREDESEGLHVLNSVRSSPKVVVGPKNVGLEFGRLLLLFIVAESERR